MRLAWEPIPGAEYYEVGLLPKDGGAGPGSDVTEPEWHTEVEPGRWYVNTGDWLREYNYVVLHPAGGPPEPRVWPGGTTLLAGGESESTP